jgi:hypothetical protein
VGQDKSRPYRTGDNMRNLEELRDHFRVDSGILSGKDFFLEQIKRSK